MCVFKKGANMTNNYSIQNANLNKATFDISEKISIEDKYANIKQSKSVEIDNSIFDILDSNKDGKINADDELIGKILDVIKAEDIGKESPTEDIEETKPTDEANEVKEKKETQTKDISELSEEEIENMNTEELVEKFRSEVTNAFFENKNANSASQKLDEFMKLFAEKYPTAKTKDGTLEISNYESLLSGFMYGMYSVNAGLIEKESALKALERLKEYNPSLIADIDVKGVRQWI